MSKTWLLIDSNNLCYRAFFSMGALSHNDIPTGVLYGFFRDILSLQQEFGSENFVFCFDLGESFRMNHLPTYKSSREKIRQKYTDEEREGRRILLEQIRLLRTKYLQDIGFSNVLSKKGFEADDFIGSVCKNLDEDDKAVIVSGDQDFYQLITKNVVVFHPRNGNIVDKFLFKHYYGISPKQWIEVKAIAGCKSDDIPGVRGVGEKTAIKYLRGEMNTATETYRRIRKSKDLKSKNLPIVRLPYLGTPEIELQEDTVTKKKWKLVMKELGMRSLLGEFWDGE